MSRLDDAVLVPRNGHTLVMGIVARISGCQGQKEVSNDDQIDHAKQEVERMYDGPIEYRVIATTGKGERLDRPELAQIEAELRKRELDLLVVEDLGRLVRGAEAVRLLGVAVDHGVRFISPNDCIDTSEPCWEEDALAACRDHVGHNAHTSKRIKYKMMNRFQKYGGATPCPIAGYIVPKPQDAATFEEWKSHNGSTKTFSSWRKDEAATRHIQAGLKLLRETKNCSTVADFFNSVGFERGQYARRKHWLGSDVRGFYKNRLLGGFPGRGFKHSIKHHETGKRRAVKSDKKPKFFECPHLAHVDIEELDTVNTLLIEANKNYRRGSGNVTDPRLHVPRKRTRCPGQLAQCWYCGSYSVWGGNGVAGNLTCSGAQEWRCWSSTGFSGALVATKTVEFITSELERLEGFHEQFADLVRQASHEVGGHSAGRWQQLQRAEGQMASERNNLLAAIAAFGPRPDIGARLNELDIKALELANERRALERLQARQLVLPESPTVLHEQFRQQFAHLAIDSLEFGDLLRPLVPQCHVHLVRMCDGGKLLPRAVVEVNLAGGFRDVAHTAELQKLLTKRCKFDLFEAPLRERIRERVVAIVAEQPGLTRKEISRLLPEHPPTKEINAALQVHELMQSQGLTSPYLTVLEPPPDMTKLRRYKNPRYCFTPRKNYERPPLE